MNGNTDVLIYGLGEKGQAGARTGAREDVRTSQKYKGALAENVKRGAKRAARRAKAAAHARHGAQRWLENASLAARGCSLLRAVYIEFHNHVCNLVE